MVTLASTGLVMGLEKAESWSAHPFAVGQGDRMILVTDGVSETEGRPGERFGRDRVRDFFLKHRGDPPDAVVEALARLLSEFRGGRPPSDDITIVAVEFSAGQ